MILDYTLQQSTEIYGLNATYTITFMPLNPISKNGLVTLEWSDDVIFYEEEPTCKIETYQVFTTSKYCTINFNDKIITIRDVFKEAIHFAPISITLDMLRNPTTNINLEKFKLRTYDD